MRNLLYRSFAPLGPQVRAIFLRPWYEYISSLDREGEVRFMNYGFQPPGDKQVLVLEPADER
ncbi:MAG: hypothetical protein HYU84_01160, partial [Chloroflexi bacterium]|nr:hypothetical protein [Chloroflexota bacterium]